jgi:TMEM175 potassium channel family protein
MPAKKRLSTKPLLDLNLEHLGLERLTFFSDAVFAIAITLLAIEIRLPESEVPLTDAQLVDTLLSLWPQYLGYVISFLVIGLFWLGHHRKFRLIQQFDSNLLIINTFMLMLVAFSPFPTSVLSEYGSRTATIFYALFMLVLGLANMAIWSYASYRNRLIDPKFDAHQRRRETLRAASVPVVFALSIALAFINANLAKLSWALLAVVMQLNVPASSIE